MLEAIEDLIMRMRWKVEFAKIELRKKGEYIPVDEVDKDVTMKYFGFRSTQRPPYQKELQPFEHDMIIFLSNLKKRKYNNNIQQEINRIEKIIRSSDKTGNWYSIPASDYKRELRNCITKDY